MTGPQILTAGALALTFSAPTLAQISGISARAFPRQVTASQLPAATGSQGMRIVTDALSSASCTIGGGSVKLVCFDNGAWTVVGLGLQGPEGPQGEAGPQGPPGEDGAAASIAVGTVTTGAAGSSASVVNSGTSAAAIFDIAIPRGDTGAAGAQGPQGAQGLTGEAGATGATGPAGADGIPRTVQDEGSDLTQRLKVNFIGSSVTCADNSGQARTDCTFASAGLTNPLANGSASTPGLYFAAGGGITRPGFYADSDKSLFFAANGSARLYFDGNSAHLGLTSGSQLRWSSGSDPSGGYDTNIARSGASELTLGTTSGGYSGLRFGKSLSAAQPVSIADNGNGSTRATGTLTPSYSYVTASCGDANGCDLTLSETGAQDGQLLRVVCTSANVCGFADSAGVSELAGAVDLGQYDSLSLLYVSDRFVELARSNN